MRKRSIWFYIFIYFLIFVAALAVMAAMVFVRVNKLTKESVKIVSMDINSESVDMSLKLSGKYGLIEKTIKDYINEYVTDVQRLSGLGADDKLAQILGTENMLKDAPDFKESRAYLDQLRTETDELTEKLIKMGTRESVDKAFSDTGLNSFLRRVYNNQMYKTISLDFFYPAEELRKASGQLESIYDEKEKVLDFLTDNKDRWHFDNNMIEFENEDLLNEYLNLAG